MRDPKRIKVICDKIAEIWESNCPDWRFGQLFCNMQRAYRSDLFYLSDDDIVTYLKELFGEDCKEE